MYIKNVIFDGREAYLRKLKKCGRFQSHYKWVFDKSQATPFKAMEDAIQFVRECVSRGDVASQIV